MNDNNTKMELVDEEKKDLEEKKASLNKLKKVIEEKINNIKSDINDYKEKKNTQKRIKQQEKMDKEKISSISNEQTITNKTIINDKNKKPVLTEQEKRVRKQKRRKIIRNIMTIPEIILIVLLVIYLKDKYIAYSKDVHQTLIYKTDDFIYEIKRDNDQFNVIKKEESCENKSCKTEEIETYEVKYSKKQMLVIRTYFDTIFKLKSTKKEITNKDINTEIGYRSIRSIIHKDSMFLDTKTFTDYSIADFEQKSDYNDKGYELISENDKYYLIIGIGEKNTAGYSITISEVHKKGNDLIFYIEEHSPKEGEYTSQIITHPVIKLQINEKPEKIKVYNIDTGVEYPKIKSTN